MYSSNNFGVKQMQTFTCCYNGCSYSNLQLDNVENHVKTAHDIDSIVYECDYKKCFFRTTELDSLKKHYEYHYSKK